MKNAFVLLSALALAAVSFAQGPGDTWVKPHTDKNGKLHEGYWRRNPKTIPMSEKEYVPAHTTKKGKFVPGGYHVKPKSRR